MTQKEMNYQTNEIRNLIEEAFQERFGMFENDDKKTFSIGVDETATIVCLQVNDGEPFFAIEYGSGEDGDSFYPSDYSDINDMIKDMLAEAEG